MDETTTGDVEEARGPHLPDVLARIPRLAWLFIALAVGYLAWFIANLQGDTSLSVGDLASYALQLAPPVAAILLPAALLYRHPDAPNVARTLFVGTVLYASVEGLLVLGITLQPFFEATTPPPEELPSLVPLALIYSLFTGLVGAFGLSYIALGLSRARRYDDGASDRAAAFVAIAAVLATIVGIVSIARLDFDQIPISPTLVLYLGSAVVLGVIRVAVWASLAAVTARGWRAGEAPATGWLLATTATALVLLGIIVVNIVSVVQVATEPFQTIYGYTVSAAFAAGHLCLLAAFLVGLPSLDDADDAGDDADDGRDEDVDDGEALLDDGGWPIATGSAG